MTRVTPQVVYQVVTKVPPIEEGGNLAIPHVPLVEQIESPSESNNWDGKYRQVEFGLSILVARQPVFFLGEIIITYGDREVIYPQRKASKWDISVEEFTDIHDAIRRSQEVTDDAV